MAVPFCESLKKQNITLNSMLLKGGISHYANYLSELVLKKKLLNNVWNATAYTFTHMSTDK